MAVATVAEMAAAAGTAGRHGAALVGRMAAAASVEWMGHLGADRAVVILAGTEAKVAVARASGGSGAAAAARAAVVAATAAVA